jgi:hypothetical protein
VTVTVCNPSTEETKGKGQERDKGEGQGRGTKKRGEIKSSKNFDIKIFSFSTKRIGRF